MSKMMKMLLLGVVSLFLVIALAACGGDTTEETSSEAEPETEDTTDTAEEAPAELEDVEIRFTWWGDTGRNEVYNEIVDRFEAEYPHITVAREFGGWGDYWDRLATQIAGGNAPDVVSMHQFYVSDYARRNALLNLNDLVSEGTIDLSDFPDSAINSGKIDDNIFMVAKGLTMPGWAYNTAVFDELGVEYPDMNWTWDDFQAKVAELSEAYGDGKWGAQDMSGGQLQPNFRYFLRQSGKDLFTEEGQLAFDKEDLVEWWTMWDDLRQSGAIPDAATGNEYENAPLEQNMFVTGRTALHQIPANQIYLYQQQFEEGEIHMVRMPQKEGGENGEYIEGAYLSITERSAHPEEAALFINFFVTNLQAAELFKVEQGPPAGTAMAEYVMDLIDPAQARAVAYINETVPYGRPAPYAPAGVNEVEQAFSDNAEAIAFGQISVEEAAERFINAAQGILQ
ncbi:ABC transporter substrate-binding protein [Bacillus alkalicellulosilyticus]|uniref:ABC transporter substrate-binding protein n=1 Tax=Alkalihalobacterium alkalicellulosilyticum TaxID=1912214 RepID=UPI0009968219|nr:sugar ABC transporter substrate-binding protein [Bacillus alkalicellulosilyticus]